jgi:hypothetical protein
MQSRKFATACRSAAVSPDAMGDALKAILLSKEGADRKYRAQQVILALESGA